jgi:5-(carboxyamino)imidazole ribonucleotide mutase
MTGGPDAAATGMEPPVPVAGGTTAEAEVGDAAATLEEALAAASGHPGSAVARDPVAAVVMGSSSDFPVMRKAVDVLDRFGVPHEVHVVSAHRTPDDMLAFGHRARSRGLRVIVAGAGGAAHLPGMLASVTSLPVIGVPISLATMDGLDSLLSIVQMPRGVPVATVAVNGAHNGALLAVRILAVGDDRLAAALDAHRQELVEQARAQEAELDASAG